MAGDVGQFPQIKAGIRANWELKKQDLNDLLAYRQTMHQIGIGVICAVGYLDFDSARITASSINRGFLP